MVTDMSDRWPVNGWSRIGVGLGALLVAALAGCEGQQTRLSGFSEEAAAEQHRLERSLLGEPSGARMNEYHVPLTAEPHHAATEANERTAEYIAERLREFGFDSILMPRYEVLLPRPIERSVTLLEPARYELRLTEPPLDGDPDTEKAGVLPPFNAFSADGDVTAEVVYVNYGLPDDYAILDSLGISVEGRIVLARYGRSWRGIKPRLAADRGAVGALLYSDPEDDGFVRGPVMPDGPWRPEHGVQLGSVMDMPTHPGDPQTPFTPSLPGAERLPLDSLPTVQRIPVQPISYGDAEPILRALGGTVVPEAWQGGLPFEYHVGPGPATVHLKLRFDWTVRPIVNVIGLLLGQEEPDRWVMAGGHRDAWTFGGRDPMSGAVSLLESARTIAETSRWLGRPRRTIAVASWDAEDWGLIGSTEWGEELGAELQGKVVAYVNRESYTAGPFSAAGSHAFQPLVNDVLRQVSSPEAEGSIYDDWMARIEAEDREWADSADAYAAASADPVPVAPRTPGLVDHGGWTDVRLGALGSGSDYTVFIDHLGIPSLDLRFDSPNGVYHSRYDTQRFFTTFGDPGFQTGERLAEVVALLLTRLANADVLPLDYTATAETIDRYLDELEAESDRRDLTVRLDSVRAANESFSLHAAAINAAIDNVLALPAAERDTLTATVDGLNDLLLDVEAGFLHEAGLPGRPWYRHQLYAPGFDTGYGVKTVPGVREAIERGDAETAQTMTDALEDSLRRIVEQMREALQGMRGLSGEVPRSP